MAVDQDQPLEDREPNPENPLDAYITAITTLQDLCDPGEEPSLRLVSAQTLLQYVAYPPGLDFDFVADE